MEDYPCALCGWTDGEHSPNCLYNSDSPEPPYHTQGGGTAKWDSMQHRWVFVEPPPDFPNLQTGDSVPEQWGIGP